MKHNQTTISVIAASLFLMLFTVESGAAVKQIPRPGQFQVVTSGDGTRVWRLNTLTGEMLYCSSEDDSKLPVCKRVEIPELRGGRPSSRY